MNKEIEDIKLDIEIDNKLKVTIIKNIFFFDLFKTLDSGQTFRYEKVYKKGKLIGAYVCTGNVVTYFTEEINLDNTVNLIIHSIDKNVVDLWINFFNLKTNYKKINEKIIKIEKNMKDIINISEGVRIIKMDLWESILTFIISANNNMARIKSSVNLLSERYGNLIFESEDKKIKFYEIPRYDKVAKLSLDEIRNLKVGFRDKYILDAATKIKNKELDIESLYYMTGIEVKENLMKIKGIGDKVADCIRLFALNKVESFPVDVWIERYMLKYDLKDDIDKGIKYDRKKIEKYAEEKYKELAGYAQQYIFYYCITILKQERM